MVVHCSAFGCINRKKTNKDLQFHRLPKVIEHASKEKKELSRKRRRLWLASLGLKLDGKNLDNLRVCSAHFISGQCFVYYNESSLPNPIPLLVCVRKV